MTIEKTSDGRRAATPRRGALSGTCRAAIFLSAVTGAVCAAAFAQDVPTVMNIVNFVRGSDPRNPERDLLEPLRGEIALNTKYRLPNTILLQYDALLRGDIVQAAKEAERDRTEYGVWMEMCRQLIEKVGISWRGRPGWDWEWFVNPGLPMGYEPEERERICDEVFRLFRDTFGYYPKSVGGWLLDAHTMRYLTTKYGVDAFCICREQDSTDAYGLRGGYANGAYYPSRKDALSAAVDMANAIRTPVFRMLTPDPIYNYGPGWNERGLMRSPLPSVGTIEPGCPAGQRPDIVDWFFRVYTGPARLGFSYMQTGQENSFGWAAISKGLPNQMKIISELAADGRIKVMTLGETGRWFKSRYSENVPQTLVALEDWSGNGYKSVWYSSKRYRMNLFFDGRRVCFRDIHKFCDDHRETYLEKACAKWCCNYSTPPVVDGFQLAGDGESGMADFKGEFCSFDAESADDRTLRVTAARTDGSKLVLVFREDAIDMDLGDASFLRFRGGGPFFESLEFPPGRIDMEFEGVKYSVSYDGNLKPSLKGWTLFPIRGRARLSFGRE